MALIACSECGRAVSDKAAVCIGCGAPLTTLSPILIIADWLVHGGTRSLSIFLGDSWQSRRRHDLADSAGRGAGVAGFPQG